MICIKCGESSENVSFKCKVDTPEDMKDFCVPCRAKQRRLNYQKGSGKKKHLQASSKYTASKKGKESKIKWRDKNKKKLYAHGVVAYRIKTGELIRKPCETCGSIQRVHAHHDDYSNPLDVRWLCPEHHKKWHDENGEGKNA